MADMNLLIFDAAYLSTTFSPTLFLFETTQAT
jgi:hypothetical protein